MSGGGGAGVMQAAIEVLRANKKLLQRRNRHSFRELRQMYLEEDRMHGDFADEKLTIKKVDKAILEALRAKLRHERSRNLTIHFMVILITLAIGFAGLFWVLQYL